MAQINLPRVRVTCNAPGTGTFSSLTRSYGSYGIAELITKGWIATGDLIDYVASQGEAFEEGRGTIDASGNIVRTTINRARHAVGTINTTVVSFSGIVTIIVTFDSTRVADLITLAAKAIRADQAQSLSAPEQAQARANAPPFAATTASLFYQTSAPIGWTKQTTHTDKALRVTSGSIGSGGSVDFSTCFSRQTTDAFTIGVANLPGANFTLSINVADPTHSHTLNNATNIMQGVAGASFGGGPVGTGVTISANANATGLSGSNITGTAASGGSGVGIFAGMDMRVKFIDVIIALKD
jgi:hypothetical protein